MKTFVYELSNGTAISLSANSPEEANKKLVIPHEAYLVRSFIWKIPDKL